VADYLLRKLGMQSIQYRAGKRKLEPFFLAFSLFGLAI
jgi:hypothetical protein